MTGGEVLGFFKSDGFRGFGGGSPDCWRLSLIIGDQLLISRMISSSSEDLTIA